MILIDANNRTNAVLNYILAPLSFFTHYIPKEFSDSIRANLQKAPLEQLLKPRYTLTKFCNEHSLQDYNESKTKQSDEDAWDAMILRLAEDKFLEINLQLSTFKDLTDEEVAKIYQDLNTGGTKLTKQDLLAGSWHHVQFTSDTLESFQELRGILEKDYWGEMNKNELLNVDNSQLYSISLFELFIAFQIKLSKRYTFISYPGKDKQLDTVFRVYGFLYNNSMIQSVAIKYLNQLETGCQWISDILDRFYDPRIDYNDITKYRNYLDKNRTILLLVYIMNGLDSISTEILQSNLRHVMVYHDILSLIAETKDLPLDSIRYAPGGTFIPNQVQKIKATCCFEYIPTLVDIKRVLSIALNFDIKEGMTSKASKKCNKRKPLSKMKALGLSAFYNTQIPSHYKTSSKHDKDHIVPFSSLTSEGIDICRLGNLQLIHGDLNKKRGKKPITDAWVNENGLKYMEYPSESEYKEILREGRIDAEKFSTMCSRREVMYIDAILKLL